jgi:hypothetical protein
MKNNPCMCPVCDERAIGEDGYCTNDECKKAFGPSGDLPYGCDCADHLKTRKVFTACSSCGKEESMPCLDLRCEKCRKENWESAVHCENCDDTSNRVNFTSHGYCNSDGSDMNPDEIVYLCESCGEEVQLNGV